jgi:hypothetical protein
MGCLSDTASQPLAELLWEEANHFTGAASFLCLADLAALSATCRTALLLLERLGGCTLDFHFHLLSFVFNHLVFTFAAIFQRRTPEAFAAMRGNTCALAKVTRTSRGSPLGSRCVILYIMMCVAVVLHRSCRAGDGEWFHSLGRDGALACGLGEAALGRRCW